MHNRSQLSMHSIKSSYNEKPDNKLLINDSKRNSISVFQSANSTGGILDHSSNHRKLVSQLRDLNYSTPNKGLEKNSLSSKILNIDTGSSSNHNSNIFLSNFYKAENNTGSTLKENLNRKKTKRNELSLDNVKQKINSYQRSIHDKVKNQQVYGTDQLLRFNSNNNETPLRNNQPKKIIATENLFKKNKLDISTASDQTHQLESKRNDPININKSQLYLQHTPLSKKTSNPNFLSLHKSSALLDEINAGKISNKNFGRNFGKKLDFDESLKNVQGDCRFPHMDAVFKIRSYFENVNEDEILKLDKISVSGLLEIKALINKKLATSPYFQN